MNFSALDQFLETLPEQHNVPAYDLMVCFDGNLVYRKFGGIMDRQTGVPMRSDAVWQMYSSTKMFTCCAALQLFERGKFYLNQPLSDFYPEFSEMRVRQPDGQIRKAQQPIRIRHLFAMTAGFTYDLHSPSMERFRSETNGKCPTAKMPHYLAQEPLLFEPGTGWNYSLCHDVLAALIEKWSGQRFGDYLQEHIFNPLGLKDTSFLLHKDQLERMVTKYRYDATRTLFDCDQSIAYRLGEEYESGGAGLYSTTEDAMRFLEGLRTEKIISRATMELMRTNQLNAEQLHTFQVGNRIGYGYGLGVRTLIDRASAGTNCPLYEFGWGGAAGTHQHVDVDGKVTFFYAQQVLNPDGELSTALRNIIYAILPYSPS